MINIDLIKTRAISKDAKSSSQQFVTYDNNVYLLEEDSFPQVNSIVMVKLPNKNVTLKVVRFINNKLALKYLESSRSIVLAKCSIYGIIAGRYEVHN